MDAQYIKTADKLALKPNAYFTKISTPYRYQVRGVLMMLMRPRMILGDDVGIGKTIQTIVAFTYIKAKNPNTKAVVFTEKSTLQQWVDEFEMFSTGIKTKIVTAETHVDPANRIAALRLGEYDVIITTYSTAYDYSQYLLEGLGDRWVFIGDEPNYFKNLDTMLHRNMNGMVNGDITGHCYRSERYKDEETGKMRVREIMIPGTPCIRAYGLTATIIENRLEEAFGVMRVITPGTFPGKADFEKRYCVTKKVPGIKARKVVGYKNLDKFRQAIEPVFYGRLQDDPEVEQDLPEVIFKDLNIELGDAQGRKLVEATDRLFENPDGVIKQVDILPSLILAQKMASDPRMGGFDIVGAKTEALIEMLQNSLAGERVVIFSKFRQAIDLIEAEILKRNMEKPVRITGLETSEQRETSKTRFMSDDPMKRANILLMTRAGQRGLNLQKGGVLIFYDMPWSYGAYRQIIGRLKRTGSTQTHIAVIHLLGKLSAKMQAMTGVDLTIDHHTLATVRKKFSLWQAITGDVKEIASIDEALVDVFEAIRNSKKLAA